MPATFTLISSVTVGSGGAASIGFTSIPGTYTDLIIKLSARDNRALTLDGVLISFNGSTSNFTNRYLIGDGTNVSSDSLARLAANAPGATATGSVFGNGEIYIPNYASANYKSFSSDSVTENNATSVSTGLFANLWSNTAAITSITLTPNNGTLFDQYSTAYLYGISNA
jgi:hypothetical protein